LRYEWDERKNRANLRKHGVGFELAIQIFEDPFCFTIPDDLSGEEERLLTFGRLQNLLLLLVVHTTRDQDGEEILRVISARMATPSERRLYEELER
jgi:uncharacterized protein